MKNKYILSVVIPVYNMQNYIVRCLDSLSLKNNKNLECIVVNDGSTDDSLNIVKKYKKINNLDNLVIFSKKNEGYGPTISKGIELSKSKYIKILDSDDWYNSEELKEHIKYLQNCNDDIVFTNYVKVQSNKKKRKDFNFLDEKGSLSNIKQTPKIFNLLQMHSLTVSKSLTRSMDSFIPKGIYFTDIFYVYYILTFAKTYSYHNVTIYNYFIGRAGQTVEKIINEEKFNKDLESYKKVFLSIINHSLILNNKFQLKKITNYLILGHFNYSCKRLYNSIKNSNFHENCYTIFLEYFKELSCRFVEINSLPFVISFPFLYFLYKKIILKKNDFECKISFYLKIVIWILKKYLYFQ